MKTAFLIRRSIPLTVLTGFLVLGAGCKNPFVHEQPAPAAQQAAPAAAPQPAAPLPREATSRLAVTFRPKSVPSPR